MKYVIDNWFIVVAAIAVLAVAGYSVYLFVKKPTPEQLKQVKEWLLFAVTQAEKELGGGTGQIKLRYVYDLFLTKFSTISKIISFEMFSFLVDGALDEMKSLLETNVAVKEYVKQEGE